VLDGVIASAEKRDADAVVNYLSAGFRDADGGSRADAAETVKRYLAAYESLSLTVSNLTLERKGPVGQATFTLKMSGKPRAVGGLEGLLPHTSRWRFELRMEAEPGGWKITHAAWSQLEEGR
jgi:hypothetical protein